MSLQAFRLALVLLISDLPGGVKFTEALLTARAANDICTAQTVGTRGENKAEKTPKGVGLDKAHS